MFFFDCDLNGLKSGVNRHLYLYPGSNYMFKVNNRNTRTKFEICSKLTIKTP